MCAEFEMRFHSFAHHGRDILVKIVRNFPPDFDAADFNSGHRAPLYSPWSDSPIRLSLNPATVESRGKAVSQEQAGSMMPSFHGCFRNT
jgi:hypothetical protein